MLSLTTAGAVIYPTGSTSFGRLNSSRITRGGYPCSKSNCSARQSSNVYSAFQSSISCSVVVSRDVATGDGDACSSVAVHHRTYISTLNVSCGVGIIVIIVGCTKGRASKENEERRRAEICLLSQPSFYPRGHSKIWYYGGLLQSKV